MGQRQNPVDDIARADPSKLGRGFPAKAHVVMGKHHAFRVAGGSGGVQQNRHIAQVSVRIGRDRGCKVQTAKCPG